MSIEGVGSYADIYSENLTEEDIKDFDDLGVEWRGRNILDIRDDFCIKAIEVYARVYEQKAITDPAELPQLKAEIVQIFEDIFDTESEDEDETSSLLYRFDPVSGTYRELIGAEGGFFESAGKCFKKAGKGIKKGVKVSGRAVKKAGKAVVQTIVPPPKVYKEAAKFIERIERPIVNAEAKAVEWVEEHPVETAVIAVAVVAVVVTAGAASGAIAGAIDAIAGGAEAIAGTVGTAAGASAAALAANSGSNNDRRKDSNKDNKSTSPPSSPPPTQNAPSPSSGPMSKPSSFNPTPPYTPSIAPQAFSPTNPLTRDPFPQPAFPPPNIISHETSVFVPPSHSIPKSHSYNPPSIIPPTQHPLLSNLPPSIVHNTQVELPSSSPHVAMPTFVQNPIQINPAINISPAFSSVESLIASELAHSSVINHTMIPSYQQTHFESMKGPATQAMATHNSPNLNRNARNNSPIQKEKTSLKKQDIQPVSWAKGVPIWQEGDPLPPEGTTLVAICARKGGVLLNDPTREGAFRQIQETGGHAWLEFVESDGKQSSISTHRGEKTEQPDANAKDVSRYVCQKDIKEYQHDHHTIRINYLIPTPTAKLIKQAATDHASEKYNLFLHNCVHTSHEGAKVASLEEFFSVIKPTYAEDGPAHADERLTLPSAVYSQIEKKIDELRGSDHPFITPPPEHKNEIVWVHLATDDPYAPSTFSPNEAFRHESEYLERARSPQTRGNFEHSKEETNLVP